MKQILHNQAQSATNFESLKDIMPKIGDTYNKMSINIYLNEKCKLQDMEPTQRPIHCSDTKRLQFYVKDADKWEKDKSHEKINKTIDEITFKQIKHVKLWETEHPNYLNDDKLLMEWQTMIRNITGGDSGDGDTAKNKSSVKSELVDKKI